MALCLCHNQLTMNRWLLLLFLRGVQDALLLRNKVTRLVRELLVKGYSKLTTGRWGNKKWSITMCRSPILMTMLLNVQSHCWIISFCGKVMVDAMGCCGTHGYLCPGRGSTDSTIPGIAQGSLATQVLRRPGVLRGSAAAGVGRILTLV